VPMPRYKFRCHTCDDVFEIDRPMARASEPANCPQGHAETLKLLSTVALTGRAGATGSAAPAGGCCGGACGC